MSLCSGLTQVEKMLTPGLRQGAARVFLQFLSYSDGPLPEEQLAAVQVGACQLAHRRCAAGHWALGTTLPLQQCRCGVRCPAHAPEHRPDCENS